MVEKEPPINNTNRASSRAQNPKDAFGFWECAI